jgi:hypothetical protein
MPHSSELFAQRIEPAVALGFGVGGDFGIFLGFGGGPMGV